MLNLLDFIKMFDNSTPAVSELTNETIKFCFSFMSLKTQCPTEADHRKDFSNNARNQTKTNNVSGIEATPTSVSTRVTSS